MFTPRVSFLFHPLSSWPGDPLSAVSAGTACQATLSTRLRPFSTCIFIRCVNNYRGHKTWYTADADLYIGAAIDAPSHGWSAVWLADRSTDLLVFSMNIRPRRTVLPSCVQKKKKKKGTLFYFVLFFFRLECFQWKNYFFLRNFYFI